jgi:hypothetical protein
VADERFCEGDASGARAAGGTGGEEGPDESARIVIWWVFGGLDEGHGSERVGLVAGEQVGGDAHPAADEAPEREVVLGLGPGDDAATGSDWQDALGSVRVMWREQGQGIAYLYLPLEIAKDGTRDGTIKVQGKAFEDAAEGSLGKHAGIDVFFKNRAGLQFSKGQWNTVRIQVKLNTPGKSDGFFELTINDETRRVDNVIFRKSKDIRINLALVVAFFGGSTLEWAAKKKETLSFKDFNITCP